jgi:polysaccharide biosynthesis/export protein
MTTKITPRSMRTTVARSALASFAILVTLQIGAAQQTGASGGASAVPSTLQIGTQPDLEAGAAGTTRVGPGDLLSIKVFDVPELDQTIRIDDAGSGSFSLIGPIHVAGKTCAEIQATLENEYRSRQLLLDPHLTVLVTEYATQGVSVLGEVAHPGTYSLIGPHSLLNMISVAGGLTQLSGGTVSIGHQDHTRQVVNLNANSPNTALDQDIPVSPGDRIVVSRASVVYVVGDVGKPGGFQMQNNGKLTVLQVIALASGVNRTAALSHAKLIRSTSSEYQQVGIHLDRLLHGQSPDVALAPNDILFIPSSKVKNAVATGLSTVLQSAATAAIYRP